MSRAHQIITLDNVWEKISKDIEHLFTYQTLRYSKWMLTYTCIFDYCTSSGSDNAGLVESFREYLRNYLENHFQPLGDLLDEGVLQWYINQWNKYRISSQILHGICSYLHRHYIRREHDSGNTNVCEIYPMAMQIWHQVVSRLYQTRICEICLNMIKCERNHQKVDTEIIGNIIQIYVTFQLRAGDDDHLLDFYQEYFEDRFLQDAQDFYRLEAMVYLQQHSVMDYLSKLSEYFHEEVHRVSAYVHHSSIIKLIEKLEETLIRDQLTVIYAEAQLLIHDERKSELNLLFRTVNRIQNGKIGLINLLENHIYQICTERINLNPTNASLMNDYLRIYIQIISDLHKKYLIFIQESFDNDQDFLDALNRTFRKIVNENSVIQSMGNTTIMAESLARYCDKLLRKGRKDETDLETIIDQLKILLFYMQDKDIFANFYSKFLAKRLINQTSISNDYEKLLITTIQNACGFEYASKMKQMSQDIETSETILEQYHKTEQMDPKINFKIMILNSNAWLFSMPRHVILPHELQSIFDHFTIFYKQIHSGRRLVWLHQYSKGELQMNFTKKVYTFQVSVYQMMILLLFNNSLEWTIEAINEHTEINMNLLLRILNVLIQSKILTCSQCMNDIDLDFNCKIKFSTEFTSEKSHVNLNTAIQFLDENDQDVCQKKIDHNRVIVIQAAIVRIMKSHQTMNQTLLIQTVIEQLNTHFNPNISMIKDCINMLIRKEYLEQSSYNPDLLRYLN